MSSDTIVSPPYLNLDTATPETVLNYFLRGWEITECLFSALISSESYYHVPDRLRHPLIFYFGHPAVFYINKMVATGIISEDKRINPYFEEIFAVGVDEMSWDDYSREAKDWPPVEELREYRDKVFNLVKELIMKTPFTSPITWEHPFWAFIMGAEHGRIHIETSSVLFRQLPVDELKKPVGWPEYAPVDNEKIIDNQFIEMPDSVVELGKSHGHHSYGWDAEFGKRVVTVPSFRATKFLITNKEYLEFVTAGGYNESKYWSDEGWAWKIFVKSDGPLFWKNEEGNWKFRALFNYIEMPWNWPVEVNHHEVRAYCAWRGEGYRSITEAEWKVILGEPTEKFKGTPEEDAIMRQNPGEFYNFNLKFGSSTAVDMYPPSSCGFYDVLGNVWEWTEDQADGFPGFKVHSAYLDFSTPCFDGLHNVIKGGSWISCGDEASSHARYWFRRHFFQHCGFRLVQQVEPVNRDLYPLGHNPYRIEINRWHDEDPYEHDDTVSTYVLYAYGGSEETLPFDLGPINDLVKNFPKRCAEEVMRNATGDGSALDLGCGVGRSTFELARKFKNVHGIEYSKAFVEVCNKLVVGSFPYSYRSEGSLRVDKEAFVDKDIERTRVTFSHGDATNLPEDIGVYDAVLLANLLDRVRDPMKLLRRLPSLVNPGGIVVITSPYTWMEAFTPKANWLGGYKNGEEGVDTFTTIESILSSSFSLVEQKNMPMIIREHRRKHQLCIAHCTIWRRK